MVTTVVSTAVMTWPVPAPVVIAIAAVKARAVVITGAVIVVIRRIARVVIGPVAWVVIRAGIHIVAASVVITAGQPQTENHTQQQSTKHRGLLKDPQPELAG
jgi:Na+/H+ antiporter NhaA